MVIDYTGVSTPLSVDQAYADMTEAALSFGDDAVRFRMWEHQWDWIVKEVSKELDVTDAYLYRDNQRWLWGCRVELADEDPKPIAIIQVDSPLSDEEAEAIRQRFEELQKPYVQVIREEQQAIVERAKAKC